MIQCKLIASNKKQIQYQQLEEFQGLEIGNDGQAINSEMQTEAAKAMNRHLSFLLDSPDTDRALDAITGDLNGSMMTKWMTDMRMQERFDKLLVTVVDTGVGVKKKNMEMVFNNLGIFGDNRTINKKMLDDDFGALGLYVAAKIIKRSGGNIAFKTKQGRGSVYQFTMPLEHDPTNLRQMFEIEQQILKDAILEERVSFDTSKSISGSRQNLSDKRKVQMMLQGDASRSKSSAVSVPTLKSDKTVTSSSKPR